MPDMLHFQMKSWTFLWILSCTQMANAVDQRMSGSVYLSPQLQVLQNDTGRNPIALWLDRGKDLWQTQCQSCHADIRNLKLSAVRFPRLTTDGTKLQNLEDQIAHCLQRSTLTDAPSSSATTVPNDHGDILALSAALHQVARGERIQIVAAPAQQTQWQTRLDKGQQLYQTRMGRMNLACMHCHDQKVGAQMRADTISQGHPTGFPIYRMGWQTLGSMERRLRACYSGVQATIPSPGNVDLRDLEFYMKVRANGMLLDGPSIRR
jgi:sulfur-oxidizing protein SoxA